MSKMPAVRSGDIAYNGALPPFAINSGLLDLVAAVSEQNGFYFPVAMEVVEIRSRVRTACGTGPGTAEVGKVGDADFFGTQAHATTDAAGTEVVWTLLNTLIEAGDVLYFSGDGGATTDGDCDVTVIVRPVSNPTA